MTSFEARPTQTKVKHEILRQYLEQWTYIIVGGLKVQYERAKAKGWSFQANFVYVDCFANSGRYAPENGTETYGSPIIGLEAMDRLRQYTLQEAGFDPKVTSILVERNRATYQRLLETLEHKGFSQRVRTNSDFTGLANGDIAVIRGDALEHIENIIAYTRKDYTWSLYFLDPYGPSGIPLTAVSSVIRQPHCDAIIYMPYQDLVKKSGSVARNDDEHPHKQHLQYFDAMFGTPEWRRIAASYQLKEISGDDARQQFITSYQRQLQAQDPQLGIKQIPLLFPDRDRIMYYLFLTTHDGAGGLAMNRILDNALISEFDHREEWRVDHTGQLSMFDVSENPGRPKAPEFSVDEIAQTVDDFCKGETLQYREVLRRIINSPYYADDVKKAMTKLKTRGRATWSGKLLHGTSVAFRP